MYYPRHIFWTWAELSRRVARPNEFSVSHRRRDFISGIDSNFPNGSLKINRAAQRDLSAGARISLYRPERVNIALSLDAYNIITMPSFSSLCLLLFSPLSRHPAKWPNPPCNVFVATTFSGSAILILCVPRSLYCLSLSLSLSVSLRPTVTLPPRVDWIHLTGYTACDITALWCMAKRVVALRHHNLTSATERNGSRDRYCSRLVFTLDWLLAMVPW